MQRRRLVGLTAGLTSALALTGVSACGGSSALSKNVTLHMVAADYGDPKTGNSSTAYWNSLIRTFEANNPHIKVDIDVVDWTHVDDKVATMVKAGKAPDIAQMGSYAAYAAKNQLYSADDLFTVSEQADFIPSLAQAGSLQRTQYGIPWVSSSRMFFYNKKLFAHAGITKAPETWSDLAQDAKLLKAGRRPGALRAAAGSGGGTGRVPDVDARRGRRRRLHRLRRQLHLRLRRERLRLQLAARNLVDAKLIGPEDPATTNRQDVFDDFLAGKAGMINGHPTLLAQAKAKGIDVGVAPLPGQSGVNENTLGVADWMMAFKQNGHVDADGKFLQYVYDEKNTVKFLDEYGLLPVTTSASQAMQHNPKDKDLVQFLDLLPDAVFYPSDKTSWGPVSDRVKKDIGKAVHQDPKAVLSDLQIYAESQDNAEKS